MLHRILAAALALGMSLSLAGAAAAREIPAPEGRVILEVAGQVKAAQPGSNAAETTIRFDRAGLERLPQQTITTYTDWTEGPQTFQGVYLKDLLSYVEAHGREIRALALDDYSAVLPVSDAEEFPVLLALKQNGEYMKIREKGPIWIIYPNDDRSQTKAWRHNDKMVWQLRRMEIR